MKTKFILSICFFISIFLLNNTAYCLSDQKDNEAVRDNYLSTLLAPAVEAAFNELQVPGAIIGVWMADKTPWIATFGFADLETKQPISAGDKVRVGSITKTFTGTVVLQLADEGKLTLSDKLSKYFPDFPNGDNITIKQLGDMTSGIYNYSEDSVFLEDMFGDMLKPFTPTQVVGIALKHPPYFAPGTDMHYSNTNTVLLGMIVEKVTGNTLQAEIQNRILNPLSMNNTTFENSSNFPDPHAHGYMYMDDTSTVPTDVTVLNPSWGWAAGAIVSTLDDISKYAKPLATGKLISARMQEERLNWGFVSTFPSGPWKGLATRYGFAIADYDVALGHNGGIPGFNSFMGYIAEKDATIIVFVNMQNNKAGLLPADYLARQIVEKLK